MNKGHVLRRLLSQCTDTEDSPALLNPGMQPGSRGIEKQALCGSRELPKVIIVCIQKPREGARLDQNETLRAVNHSKNRILAKRRGTVAAGPVLAQTKMEALQV